MRQVENWEVLQWIHVEPGVRRKVVHGVSCTIALVELSPDAPLGMHSHAHEQISTIRAGNAEFIVDANPYTVGPGAVVRIPPHTKHGVRVLGDTPVVILDFFAPKREDFAASEAV